MNFPFTEIKVKNEKIRDKSEKIKVKRYPISNNE